MSTAQEVRHFKKALLLVRSLYAYFIYDSLHQQLLQMAIFFNYIRFLCQTPIVHHFIYIHAWVRASWIKFSNCPTICDLWRLLYFQRQLNIFRVLTTIIRSSYNCNYSFCYWLTGCTTICSRCWFGTVSCVSYGRYSCTSSWWWVSTPETCRAAYRNIINWISHILLDSY